MSAHGCKQAGRRFFAVLTVLEASWRGISLKRVAKQTRFPISNLSNWVAAFKKHGALGLLPGISTGRPTALRAQQVTTAELAGIARLVRREGSIPRAAIAYAKICRRPALARYLRHGVLSGAFRRAIREQIAKEPQKASGPARPRARKGHGP